MKKERKSGMTSVKLLKNMLSFVEAYPEISPDRVLIVSMSKNVLANIFTPARLELVRTIRSETPQSVGELAKLVKRPVEAVSRDLRILSNYGLLEFVQVGKHKVPEIGKDIVMMPLAD